MGEHFPVKERPGNIENVGKKSGNLTKITGQVRKFKTIFMFSVIWILDNFYLKFLCIFSMIFKLTVIINKTLRKYWKMENILEKSEKLMRCYGNTDLPEC